MRKQCWNHAAGSPASRAVEVLDARMLPQGQGQAKSQETMIYDN